MSKAVRRVNARRLKAAWMEMPVQHFEMLTFGEVKVGEKFIALPEPGDNEGHGGLRQAYWLFTKTREKVDAAENGALYGASHGKAVDSRGSETDHPHLLFVVRVE